MSTTTNIVPPRVPLIDDRTGLISREWYKFFIYLFTVAGSGTSDVSTVDLAVSPASKPVDVSQLAMNGQLSQMMAKYDAMQSIVQGAFLSPAQKTTLNSAIDGFTPAQKPIIPGDPLAFAAPIKPQQQWSFNDFSPANKPTQSLFGVGNTLRQKRINVNLNSAATDVETISGFPSKYWITGFRVFDTSTSLAASAATLGVFTSSGGGGTTIVTPATLTALTTAANVTQMTIATSNYQTAQTLYIRNGAAHGSAATVTVQIEIIDLS